uniref:Major capsid protein n=1 Tax=Siphoviridae sp. ctiMP24 TaxID=2825621 RepID=A0A8S5P003_9CAUD|nr:MAG TPA: Major capsid protein [Siphoviridae sp. ctiMP24]
MANSIALFKQYLDLLDEVYKTSSTTASLDISGELVRAGANAKEILIPKMTLDGLADYSRGGGYVAGDVKLEMETVTFNFDRGRKFTVDAMDNAETAGVAFGKLASEFIRTKVAPELDAFRYATYAGISGIGTTNGAALSTGADVLTALVTAQNAMDEAEVPETERELHITPTLYNLIYSVDTTKSKEVLNSFSRIVKVPQTRFYTAIDQYDGTTENETTGGFVKDTTGKNINFMVIHKPAVIQYSKHVVSKVVAPEENQTSDGWMFFYRSYGLADVYDNKVKGIYLHKAAT